MFNVDTVVAAIEANSSLKFTTQAGLQQSILNEDQFNQFIVEAENSTVILPEARFYPMVAQKRAIDRISLPGRVFRAGSDATGAKRNLTPAEYAAAQTATNHLDVQEQVAIIELGDDSLMFNIEQGSLESTLLGLFGRAGGRDIEEYALFGDKASTDLFLSKTDGWIKRATQKIYGRNSVDGTGVEIAGTRDFNPDDTDPVVGFPNNMFEALFTSVESRFIGSRSSWRIWVSNSTFNDYHEQLRRAGQGKFDYDPQTNEIQLRYKGFPVVAVPALDRAESVANGGTGRVAMFGLPSNLAYGVKKQPSIEPDRLPKSRQTDFVMTAWVDADYENENAAAVAYLDQRKP